ncbi:hypothetical protein ACN9U3_01475 [Staphylococcus caprae]|uniref:hypothetical protein n=1 Tax=Staphylococcus caprae TaxID=29380 RepID=UPI003B21389E
MASKKIAISVEDMLNRALEIKKYTVLYYDDLMSDEEKEIWNTLHDFQKASIILPFNLMLVRKNVDRRIVPSIKLNDNRIYIYPNR